MSEGGFSPEGGVPTYTPKVEDKIRTIEQPVKGDWKVSGDQGQETQAELNWEADKKPDLAEPSVADVDRLLKPSETIKKDRIREIPMPESKNISKWKIKE